MSAPKFKLMLPKNGAPKEISSNGSFIFIGANGSGKTRLGVWLENHYGNKGHRISAQKSLDMPDNTTPMSVTHAEKNLLGGSPKHSGNRNAYRWRDKPATSLLSDFDKLMVYLFSCEVDENMKYKNDSKASQNKVDPPKTKLDKLKVVWENILSCQRELVISGLEIHTKLPGEDNTKYSSSEMSDGERVIFYLIGQCLAAPLDGIIIIDEPEIHLHKSIQTLLWSEIEALRPDCTFVYLTHDLDFAAEKGNAKKIWLKSYKTNQWEWEEINEIEGFPEELLMKILGNRKPVIFVEGTSNSLDSQLYRSVLPEFLILPMGSCEQVIRATRAFKENKNLHNLNIYGIVDRDRRTKPEIAALTKDDIYVLNVAEVENLFCTQEVLKLISNRLGRNPDEDFSKASKFIIEELKREIDTQASIMASEEIKFRLSNFDTKPKAAEEIKSNLSSLLQNIDSDQIYNQAKKSLQDVIDSNDYNKLLGLYNRKSLASRIGPIFGLGKNELSELIVRLANSGLRSEIKEALKPYFGGFSEKF